MDIKTQIKHIGLEHGEVFIIDTEPTWVALCHVAERGALNAKELIPACMIADSVRQAQKNGAKSITFFFDESSEPPLIVVDAEVVRPIETEKFSSEVFARDLTENQKTDSFMGKGFEEMLKKAEAEGKEVIVGRYYKRAYIDE